MSVLGSDIGQSAKDSDLKIDRDVLFYKQQDGVFKVMG